MTCDFGQDYIHMMYSCTFGEGGKMITRQIIEFLYSISKSMCTQATEETMYIPALVKANGKCVHPTTCVCRLCCHPIIISDLLDVLMDWRQRHGEEVVL